MTDYKEIPIFFIIGRPRSGTTLLRTMFDAHPRVCIPFECPMIINLYLKYKSVKTWSSKTKLSLYEDLFKQWKFDSFRVNKEKLKNELLDYNEQCSYSDLIKLIYSHFQSVYKKTEIIYFGDKNPEYSLNSFYINRLLKIFPDAVFIHLIRDYRDNFVSYLNVDFEAPISTLISYRWKTSVRHVEKIAGKYPEKFTLQKFEDLINEPEQSLKKLCEFLNLPYNPAMLNYRDKTKEFENTFPKEVLEKYHSSTMGEINKDKINSWNKKMTKAQLKRTEFVAGKTGEHFGYSKTNKKYGPQIICSVIPWIIYGRLWYILKALIDHLPFSIRTAIIAKGPVLAWLYSKVFR